MRSIFLPVLVFFSIFFSQLFFWHRDVFTDEGIWEQRIEAFQNQLSTQSFNPLDAVFSGHPGMSFVTVAVGFTHIRFSSLEALRISVALFSALASATIIFCIRLLRNDPLWWIPAWGILLFHSTLAIASPTNVVASFISVALVLIGWILFVQRKHSSLIMWAIAWGVSIGICGVTRSVTCGILVIPFTLFLLYQKMWRPVLIAAGTAITIAVFFDPFFGYTPIQHISYILFRSSLNFDSHMNVIHLTIRDFLLFAPSATLSFFLGILFLFLPKVSSSFRPFLFLCVTTTVLFAIPFLSVRVQSIRHFMPLIFLWDILFPLLIILLFERIKTKQPSSHLIRIAPVIFVSILVIYQAFFLYVV